MRISTFGKIIDIAFKNDYNIVIDDIQYNVYIRSGKHILLWKHWQGYYDDDKNPDLSFHDARDVAIADCGTIAFTCGVRYKIQFTKKVICPIAI